MGVPDGAHGGDTTLTVADRLIGCAYPAGDLLLITIGAQVAVRQLRRGIPFWTLTASLLFMLIADVGYVPIAPQHVLRRRAARRRVVDQLRADRRRRGTPRRVQSGRTASEMGQPRLTVRRLVVLGAAARVPGAPRGARRIRSVVGRAGAARRHDGDVRLVVLRLVLVSVSSGQPHPTAHEATHDSLTGLANRTVFADRVDAARAGRPTGSPAVVLSIDLDDFKSVNDSLGHAAGDRLLRVVADRLTALLRAGDTIARLGGDEFAILLESATPDVATNGGTPRHRGDQPGGRRRS